VLNDQNNYVERLNIDDTAKQYSKKFWHSNNQFEHPT